QEAVMSGSHGHPPRPIRDAAPQPGGPPGPDQVARWAELIADGRDEFPADLDQLDRTALLAAVRRRLRERLIRLVARAVAARIYREARAGLEVPTDGSKDLRPPSAVPDRDVRPHVRPEPEPTLAGPR